MVAVLMICMRGCFGSLILQKQQELIRRWDSECELLLWRYLTVLHALQDIVRCWILTRRRLQAVTPRVGVAAWYYCAVCPPLQPRPYLL